jgi:Arc/MetJ-type ribon-helix-helix transcriptional regulator
VSTDLSPENEQYLEHAVSVGMFHDRGEALDKAVELLRRREELVRDVNVGIEQLEQGEGRAFDVAEIKKAVRSRLKNVQ